MPLYVFDVYQSNPDSFITTRQGVVVPAQGRIIAEKLINSTMGHVVRVEFKRAESKRTNQVILVGPSDIVSGH